MAIGVLVHADRYQTRRSAMKSVDAQRIDELRSQIRARFAKFNRTSSPPKGRRYPKELQALVSQGAQHGLNLSVLGELTGASSTTLGRWAGRAKRCRRSPASKTPSARRLEVAPESARQAPVTVRFPSGVSIEFADTTLLSSQFLAILASAEVSYAAAR